MSFEHMRQWPDPAEMKRQFALPRAEWSPEFRAYVEQKILETGERDRALAETGVEETDKMVKEKSYARYLKGLALREEELSGKKIVDVGSGDGEFVAMLIDKNITSDVFGTDTEPAGFSIDEKYREHFMRAKFEDAPGIRDADYVVSVGAVSGGVWGGEEHMDMRSVLKNMLDAAKEGGEVRIFPIQVSEKDNPLAGVEASYETWNKILPDIAETNNVEWRLEPVDITSVGRDNDIILEEVLVIRKQKEGEKSPS